MRYLFLLLALMAPLPALALSCMAPSIERSYAFYAASDDAYHVVHGKLTLDTKRMPDGMTGEQRPPKMTHIPAQFEGSSLSKRGFTAPFDQALTLEVSCLGPWCGRIENGAEVLAFVRKDGEGYALAITPCGGAAFVAPEPALLKRAQQCMAKKDCSAG